MVADNIIRAFALVVSITTPGGAGFIYWVRWRKRTVADRERRTQLIIDTAQQAATTARAEEKEAQRQLLAEKDATIARMELLLQQEHRENERLTARLIEPPGHRGQT